MKIALVTEFFYPTTGGTQTAVTNIAAGLGQLGHKVTVFAPLFNSTHRPSQPGENYGTQWVQFQPWPMLGYLIAQMTIWVKLAPFEVVHVFHPAFGLAALLANQFTQKRFIATLMGYDTYEFVNMPWIKQQIALSVCKHAQVVTSPSRHLAKLAYQTGIERDITIIPHGVTPASAKSDTVTTLKNKLGIAPGETVFVAIQRHHPVKEPQIFLEVWQKLAQPNYRLILVGGGELEPFLRQKIKELNLTNITLTGEVPAEMVPSYLALADVFLHHSRYESFGLGVLEAMQAGLPIIACRVGAIEEIISDGLDGLLIQPSKPSEMAAAVIRLAKSPELRAQLAKTALKRASAFTWHHLVKQYEKLYHGERNE